MIRALQDRPSPGDRSSVPWMHAKSRFFRPVWTEAAASERASPLRSSSNRPDSRPNEPGDDPPLGAIPSQCCAARYRTALRDTRHGGSRLSLEDVFSYINNKYI